MISLKKKKIATMLACVCIVLGFFAGLLFSLRPRPSSPIPQSSPSAMPSLADRPPSPPLALNVTVSPPSTRVTDIFPLSVFSQPIPQSASYTKSTAFGAFRQKQEAWAIPIYTGNSAIPLVTITNLYSGRTVHWPIPTSATPTTTSDHAMAVFVGDVSYEFWNASWDKSKTKITAGGMNNFPLRGAGVSGNPDERVSASGLSVVLGTVTFASLADGIPHALAATLSFDAVAKNNFVPPAIGGESQGRAGSGGISIGARFALPRSLDIDSLSVHPLTRALLRAARDYGIFIVDTDGTPMDSGAYVAGIRVAPGAIQSYYGVDSDSLLHTIQSETHTVISTYGLYRIN